MQIQGLLAKIRAVVGETDAVPLATLARRLLKKDGTEALNADDLPFSLLQLLTSPGAVVAVAANVGKLFTNYSPLTGTAIDVNVLGQDESMLITPAGTIAALTVELPITPRLGQIVRLNSHQIVTALTLTTHGPTPTFRGTAVTSLAADTPVTFEYVSANTWQRL